MCSGMPTCSCCRSLPRHAIHHAGPCSSTGCGGHQPRVPRPVPRDTQGARFPWESARGVGDVTPSTARDRGGHVVPIRTGLLEEHIVADIAWAAAWYMDWTGDQAFTAGPGRELLVETARYWASRIHTERDGTAHILGVIGPDEYHEPVDDNACTNLMARWNLRAPRPPSPLTGMRRKHVGGSSSLRRSSTATTRTRASTSNSRASRISKRSSSRKSHPAARSAPTCSSARTGTRRGRSSNRPTCSFRITSCLTRWRRARSNPISASTNRVPLKAAPCRPASTPPSSRRARDDRHALEALRMAARIDLDDLTATTAGGLHLGAMGTVWQAVALGFAGLRPRPDGVLTVDPRVPADWSALELNVVFQGRRVRLRKEHEGAIVWADGPVRIRVGRLRVRTNGRGDQAGPPRVELGGRRMSTALDAIDDATVARPVLATAQAIAALWRGEVEALHVGDDGGHTARAAARAASVTLRVEVSDTVTRLTQRRGASQRRRGRDRQASRPGGSRPAGHVAVELITLCGKPVIVVPSEPRVTAAPLRLSGSKAPRPPRRCSDPPLSPRVSEASKWLSCTSTTRRPFLSSPIRSNRHVRREFLARLWPGSRAVSARASHRGAHRAGALDVRRDRG